MEKYIVFLIDYYLYFQHYNIYNDFSIKDALKIKKIEEKTNHDVKAVEYFIKN